MYRKLLIQKLTILVTYWDGQKTFSYLTKNENIVLKE